MMISSFVHFAQSPPVTHVAQRTVLVAVVVVTIALALFGMRRAWSRKSHRFDSVPAPEKFAPSPASQKVAPVEARFAGTTTAGNWLDRVTVHDLGLPQSVTVEVLESGVQLLGTAEFALWIPRDIIIGVRTARGIAGDVVEPDGMIVVTWRLGYVDIDSGIRVTRHSDHELVLSALRTLVSHSSSSSTNEAKGH